MNEKGVYEAGLDNLLCENEDVLVFGFHKKYTLLSYNPLKRWQCELRSV